MTSTLIPTHYTVTIPEDVEYVDRTLQTASWWDRYIVHPGTYRLERHLDYLWVRVDATLVESYRVNRLFTASSAETTTPNQRTTVSIGVGHTFRMEDNDYTSKYGKATVLGQPVVEDEEWSE